DRAGAPGAAEPRRDQPPARRHRGRGDRRHQHLRRPRDGRRRAGRRGDHRPADQRAPGARRRPVLDRPVQGRHHRRRPPGRRGHAPPARARHRGRRMSAGNATATVWTPVCRACGARNPGTWSRCPACGGVQVLDGPRVAPAPSDGGGVWRFRDALPPVRHEVTMGEGGTPLVPCARLAARTGVAEVLVESETVNPTLSFKDRAMALGVSLARDAGAPGVVAASTGNTAVSAAAYAARAELPCRLYCAAAAAGSAKLRIAAAYGATVEPVDGDFSSAHAAAAGLEADGWFPLTTTFRNPYLAAAHRTVALEIYEQTGWSVPDWVLVPVGAGPLLVGAYEGFCALVDAGRIPRPPRMVAV